MAEFNIFGYEPEHTVSSVENNSIFYVETGDLIVVRDSFEEWTAHVILFPEVEVFYGLDESDDEKHFVAFKKINDEIFILDKNINNKVFELRKPSFLNHLNFGPEREFIHFKVDVETIEKPSLHNIIEELDGIGDEVVESTISLEELKKQYNDAVAAEEYERAGKLLKEIRKLSGET